MTHDTFETNVKTPWHYSPPPPAPFSLGWMCGGISVVHGGNGSATGFPELSFSTLVDLEARLCHQTGTMACNLVVRAFYMAFCFLSVGHIVSGLYFFV